MSKVLTMIEHKMKNDLKKVKHRFLTLSADEKLDFLDTVRQNNGHVFPSLIEWMEEIVIHEIAKEVADAENDNNILQWRTF